MSRSDLPTCCEWQAASVTSMLRARTALWASMSGHCPAALSTATHPEGTSSWPCMVSTTSTVGSWKVSNCTASSASSTRTTPTAPPRSACVPRATTCHSPAPVSWRRQGSSTPSTWDSGAHDVPRTTSSASCATPGCCGSRCRRGASACAVGTSAATSAPACSVTARLVRSTPASACIARSLTVTLPASMVRTLASHLSAASSSSLGVADSTAPSSARHATCSSSRSLAVAPSTVGTATLAGAGVGERPGLSSAAMRCWRATTSCASARVAPRQPSSAVR
mmetsp:Transcript_16856/g.42195  ORF Transcript_16856/g.42195 Transcript_16856/m.42195 type:complete len:280 (-) Transcript_16856:598-1437(-)